MDTAAFRRDVVAWLDLNAAELRPPFVGAGTLDEQFVQFRKVKAALFDAGFGRYGWPEEVGGLGGSPLLRAIVGEEVASRDLADPGCWSMIEVLAPTVLRFAAPELTARVVPPLLRGDETWCQGFSEPGAGSDLASLTCRADQVDGGWKVNGQKVWTSYVQYANYCVLLVRTGGPGSAHRGITALFVDVDSPGLTARPMQIQNGRHEFAEVFYDDVFVPEDRVLGDVGGGWQVAMDILPYERSTTYWHRGAFLMQRVGQLVEKVASEPTPTSVAAVGEAFQNIFMFRAVSHATQYRLANGGTLGAETSVDKILIASSEQAMFDAARDLLGGEIEFGDDAISEAWRSDFLYSRAATIYGGTAEIQRSIVARRLLDLGPEA